MFMSTPLKSTDPRLARAQFLKPTGTRTVFSAADQSTSGEPGGEPFFPSAGTRVFAPVDDDPLHKDRSLTWAVARGLRLWAVQNP